MTSPAMAEPIVALDVSSRREVEVLLDALGPGCTFVKVGLQLFSNEGPDVVRWLRESGRRVFLDLKFHDIPSTVAKAVVAVRDLGAELLTVHTSGGAQMLATAQDASGDLRLLGVTILTSFDSDGLGLAWGRTDPPTIQHEVVRLARIAHSAGLPGVVAAVSEAAAIRKALGPDALIVTPGIRFAGGDTNDQSRVATPAEAVRAGATHLVIGRAVTAAPDPAAALDRVFLEIAGQRT